MRLTNHSTPGGRGTALAVLAGACLALPLGAPRAHAQGKWTPGVYMRQALDRVMQGSQALTEKTEYGLDDGSICFGGAYLRKGEVASTAIPLEGGRTYAMVGGGDEDALDVDLHLQDEGGTTVARDVDDDATPAFSFTPKSNGRYRIFLKLETSKDTASFCAFALLRKGGWSVPTSDLATAARNTLLLCEAANNKTGGASFHAGPGEWGLLGTILKQGETLTHRNIKMGPGNHAIVAAADDDAQDLDLAVVDGDNTVLGKDEDDDANPVVLFKGEGSIGFQLKNQMSKNPTLAFAALLELK